MHLVFDLGNSYHKCAVYDGDAKVFQLDRKQLDEKDVEGILSAYPVRHILLSSVASQELPLTHYIRNLPEVLVLGPDTPVPVFVKYLTPGTLGNDRLAAAVAAHALYPGKNVLVIDAGTCIKYDFVNASGAYLGGAISPGLDMRFRALHNDTARLPLLSAESLKDPGVAAKTGNSTTSSILAGVGKGLLLETEGFINAYAEDHPALTVLLSGGDAWFFELHIKRRIFALPDLVLFGLHTILEYNLKKS